MSAGIKTATTITTTPTSEAVPTSSQGEEEELQVAATLLDANKIDASSALTKTSQPLLNGTEIVNSNSFRYQSSSQAQQTSKQEILTTAASDSRTYAATSCEVSPENKSDISLNVHHGQPIKQRQPNDQEPQENDEDDEDGSAVELRDTLSSNKVGTQQFSSGVDASSINSNSQEQLSPGLSLLQAAAASSPPPHSYRHSRAYRHFKNPPQPHMCIRTTTETGEELFINVLSWTRIVIPQEPSDPIPLYGGMRVPPGSPRSPPIVFAVMANPEVLKDSGRHSKDPEERRAMVELMCDFVEAMNPGVKLVRNAVILKDRDISGELKDVWNAVQAQRDREREEQMLQQRQQQQQQQHYHNMATNGGGGSGSTNISGNTTPPGSGAVPNASQQQMFSKSLMGGLGGDVGSPPRSRRNLMLENQMTIEGSTLPDGGEGGTSVSLSMLAEQLDNKLNITTGVGIEGGDQVLTHDILQEGGISYAQSNGNEFKDLIADSNHKIDLNNQLNANNYLPSLNETKAINQNYNTNGITSPSSSSVTITNSSTAVNANSCVDTPDNNAAQNAKNETKGGTSNVASNNCNATNPASSVGNVPTIQSSSLQTPQPVPVVVNPPPPPTKKEKLGGFLPNGCIFPRFTKNNKHKDKDKDKEGKEKTKEKEKNVLLSALKKSKDKKAQQQQQQTASTTNTTTIVNNANQEQQNELNNTNNTSATINNITATSLTNSKQQSSSAATTVVAVNNHHQHHQNNINNATPKTTTVTNCLQHLESEVQKMDINHHIVDNNKYNSSNNSTLVAINNKDSSSAKNTNNTGVGVH